MDDIAKKNRPVLSLALIGAGGFGNYHLTSIDTLARQGRVRLAAVVDPAIEKNPRLSAELRARKVRLYPDHERWLDEKDDCTAVTIVAPIPFHFEIASRCIERGLAVYLEKPPVPLLSQLEKLIALDKHQRVYVGFQHICYSWVQQLKEWIVAGRFGALQSIRAAACWNRTDSYYERSGWCGKMSFLERPTFDGPATNALAHLIHSIMYLGSEKRGGFAIPAEVCGELYRARRIESYDTAGLRGRFPSEVEFSVAVTHATEREHGYAFKITGTTGWAKVSRNGTRMETSFGGVQEQTDSPEVLGDSYRAFVDFAGGQTPTIHTTLADCRGYLIATNGMLISSGGIHEIPSEFVRTYGKEGRRGYSVKGLTRAVMGTLRRGPAFADLGVPWAVRTKPVTAHAIARSNMLDHLT